MSKEEYLKEISKFFSNCFSLQEMKNADYTGGSENPFLNIEACSILGIDPEVGLLTRMMDKMRRIASLISSPNPPSVEESLEDSLLDLSNYCSILHTYRVYKKGYPSYEVTVSGSNVYTTDKSDFKSSPNATRKED